MASVLTFAQLVEEEPVFIERLARDQLWARWAYDDPTSPLFPPAPIAQFLRAHQEQISLEFDRATAARKRHSDAWKRARRARDFSPLPNELVTGGADVEVGLEEVVRAPRVQEIPFSAGGVLIPGPDFESVTVVGATPTIIRRASTANPLLRYRRPRLSEDGALVQSRLELYAHLLDRAGLEAQLRPLAKALKWVRRQTPETAPLVGKHGTTRATQAAARAAASGLRLMPC
jgi:hypothetical protein